MKKLIFAAAATMSMAAPSAASAATVIASLPDFNGTLFSSGFPVDLGSAGTFNYFLPAGATITSAFIGGTFGTSEVSTSTAAFDVNVDGTVVTACPIASPTCFEVGAAFRPFDIALPSSAFANLLDGTASLGIIMTSASFVRYGSPTLTINFDPLSAVPEPATWAFMLFGFGAIGGAMRRQRKAKVKVSYA